MKGERKENKNKYILCIYTSCRVKSFVRVVVLVLLLLLLLPFFCLETEMYKNVFVFVSFVCLFAFVLKRASRDCFWG